MAMSMLSPFFGKVPRSIVYDNDRCLVAKIMPDGTRKRTDRFSAMLSHYIIKDRYGRPGKGNDKGKVEGLVGFARRNFMVPPLGIATHCLPGSEHRVLTVLRRLMTIWKTCAVSGKAIFCGAIQRALRNGLCVT